MDDETPLCSLKKSLEDVGLIVEKQQYFRFKENLRMFY
jgi:hypothetical protein